MAKKKIKGARHHRRLQEKLQEQDNLQKQAFSVQGGTLIEAARNFERGNFFKAASICKDLIAKNPNDDGVLNLIGCIYARENRQDIAIPYFKKAISINSTAHGYYLNLGRAFLFSNKAQEGIVHLKKSIELKPDNPDALLWLGKAHARQLKLVEAEEYLRKALSFSPNNPLILENFSAILQQGGKTEEALQMANRLSTLPAPGYVYLLTLAKIKRQKKDYGEAEKNVKEFISRAENDEQKSMGVNELAKIQDKKGQYKEAFDNYVTAQTGLAKINSGSETSRYFNALLKASLEWFNESNVKLWQSTNEIQEAMDKAPVFLVGFPRSGTTLTEQILSTHPSIISTQEANLVDSVILNMGNVLGYPPQYPHVLNDLKQNQIIALRRDYMDKLAELFPGEDLSSKTIIDKMPFNIINLGFIRRIFPEAKIIVMLRDPRDACLSCFMQPFMHNSAMSNFYSMENTVSVYDDVMKLYLCLKQLFPDNLKEVRYEDLVADLEKKTREIIQFIGKEWDESVIKYYENNDRPIRTPNEGVLQPIYNSSIGRWRNYKDQIAPYISGISPYIKNFGYED